jgi:hypothetical protein
MRRFLPAFAAAFFCGCVVIPGAVDEDRLAPRSAITGEVFPGLDAGFNESQGLHFLVRAYGSGKAQQIVDIAEADYQRIMMDTGLSSFKPLGGLYRVIIYATSDEYLKKTGQPNWSSGLSIGNAIYTYEGSHVERVLCHEMTHLIFYEFMGRALLDHRWVNEGLAVYEEGKAGRPAGASTPAAPHPAGWQPLSMETMIRMIPASEREYTVNAWYAQAESLVRFMIERGGRIGFGQFLTALRQDVPFDKALPLAFPGVWRDLADFEVSWRSAQQ